MGKVFDIDRHVIEPMGFWKDYVDSRVFEEFPVHLSYGSFSEGKERSNRLGLDEEVSLLPVLKVGDHVVFNKVSEALKVEIAKKAQTNKKHVHKTETPQGQLDSMDQSNVERAILFSTYAGYVVNHSELPADISIAYAEGYNRWLYDYSQADSARLLGVGLISRHDPKRMVSQLKQIVDYGFPCITLRPEVIQGRSLGSDEYAEFWQVCEEHNISIALHGGTHLAAPTVGTERFDSRFGMHACSHPLEMQMAFVSLLESGVLERHPSLRFAFLEAGSSWVPYWLWRLDSICYPEFPELVKENIKMLPSEYFKRQCWVGVELGEPCLKQTAEMIGIDRLVFGSDYPHLDHLHADTTEIGCELEGISDSELNDVLYNNTQRFLALD